MQAIRALMEKSAAEKSALKSKAPGPNDPSPVGGLPAIGVGGSQRPDDGVFIARADAESVDRDLLAVLRSFELPDLTFARATSLSIPEKIVTGQPRGVLASWSRSSVSAAGGSGAAGGAIGITTPAPATANDDDDDGFGDFAAPAAAGDDEGFADFGAFEAAA
jgi:hypothetical protein